MGNCESALSTPACNQNSTTPLKADPDIVGTGVIAAFLITALAAFSTFAFAYFTDSIKDDLLNDVDVLIVERYKYSAWSRLSQRLQKWWRASKDIFWKFLFWKHHTAGYSPLSKENRIEAVRHFSLALSDQILATGLAILVAGIANRCQLSLFEFNIVVSLGWFSVTTHLATLILLREYFLQNRIVRNIRIIAMLASTGLLAYGLIISGFMFEAGLDSTACFAYALSYTSGLGLDPYNSLTTIPTVVYLLGAFGGAVLSSSSIDEVPGGYSSWFLVALMVPLVWVKYPGVGPTLKERAAVAREAADQYFEKSSDDLKEKQKRLPQLGWYDRYLVVVSYYFKSFFSSVANRFFDLSYGLSQLVAARWWGPPNLDESDNRMDFGQIVPLFLLVIPMLAGAEIYFEYHKEKKTTRSATKPASSSPKKVNPGTTDPHVSETAIDSHSSGPYRLADPVNPDPRRLQADAFYGVQSLNVSENTLPCTDGADKREIGTQTDSQPYETSTAKLTTSATEEEIPFKDYLRHLVVFFTIHLIVAIAIGITLNLTSAGAIIGIALAFATLVPFITVFVLNISGISKRLKPVVAEWERSHASQKSESGTSSLTEASESPAHELKDLARVQRESSYTMHGALSPEIGELEASSSENDASTGSHSVTETERRIVTEAHQQSSNTALQALGADISDEVNYATHGDLPGPTTNRISASHVEQTDTGRESPDLYGATPPRTGAPEPIPEELGVANGGSQHAMLVATPEDADRENDGRLYIPRHQDTEGDCAIPELIPNTATTTSVQRPPPALKRQWTK